ncbi:MAG: alpha/beta hydrolase [Verrucomicrobiota bacterium]|nr:alpha/beta hydrolase [Verrucomicrobiota bacterium]
MTRVLFATASAIFLCSLLVLFPAPTSSLVIAAIIIAEWGYYFAIVAIAIALMAWKRGSLGKLTALLALIAALLCLSPTLRAIQIAASLPARCDEAFGRASNDKEAFRFLSLFTRSSFPDVELTTHVYAEALALDLYQSKDARAPQPLIIMIHGGSWSRSSKEELPVFNSYLAHENYTVAAINYRHAPKCQFPAQVDDVFRAIDFLKTRADELHIDPTRIVLIGRSAGAQVALSAAYSGRDSAIRGVIAFYPPTDLVFGYDHPSARWVLDSKKVLQDYLGGTLAQEPAQYVAASPINFVNENTPPTVLIHGGLDSVIWPVHSEMLAARLEQARIPHFYLSLGWATHGCDANLHGPSGQLSSYVIDRFLASTLSP